MAQSITLRVLQGADRGRVFPNLSTPITIGREEGNIVQLNDERISRFHVKIQEDDGRLVVTDLESTNGTRVNGQVCNLKILRNGDTISVGRTVLLVGNRPMMGSGVVDIDLDGADEGSSTRLNPDGSSSQRSLPTLPRGMTPGQAAELRELLDHIHAGLRSMVENGVVSEKEKRVEIEQRSWAKLLIVQSDISEWIRAIEDPQASQSGSRD
jgi:pSer/pThr/pTyr-binding forkhead associated (FHA) protein